MDRERTERVWPLSYQTDRDTAVRRGMETDVICLPDTSSLYRLACTTKYILCVEHGLIIQDCVLE